MINLFKILRTEVMMQNTVFNDARLWVFILLFSIFFVRLETVHNIEGAFCELSISRIRLWRSGRQPTRGAHTAPSQPGSPAAKVASDGAGPTFDISRLYNDSPSLEQNLFPNNSLSSISLFINMRHMATSIPKKVLGSSVEVQNVSGLEERLPGVPGCRPCISLLI